MNDIFCCDNEIGMKEIKDETIDLIFSDPPYYKVKGDFDFIFKSFDEYLNFIENQAIHYKRILKKNGAILIYGHAKTIAYIQIIFDKYFKLINNLVWEKPDCQSKRCTIKNMRMFIPVTERILLYEQKETNFHIEAKGYMIKEREKTMIKFGFKTISRFNNWCNGILTCKYSVSRHSFSDSQFELPSRINYEILGNESGFFQMDYDELRNKLKMRDFNISELNTDVLKFSQESHITKRYNHPTKKPNGLTKLLIESTTKENDLILVPFVGSGTECAMAKKLKRNFIGFELDETYYKIAKERIEKN